MRQANDLLKCRGSIIKAFKDGIFLSEHLKKSDDGAYNYILENVNEFIEEIKSIKEKINLSLFKEFFELSSPAKYAKELINTKNQDENKKRIEEIKYRISDLEDIIKKMSENEKKGKIVYETLEIIKKILDYNKEAQNFFHCASKVDKKIKTKDCRKYCREGKIKKKQDC